MTERLSALLRDEADALDIPPVDHAAILLRGQQARVRRRPTAWLAAAAVVAVIGSVTALGLNGSDDRVKEDTPSGPSDGPSRGVMAYGAGSTVVAEGRTVTIPDSLHSLHYTSVGVLARSNPNGGASDGSGPESLTLVTADGDTTDLGTVAEGAGPATDPDEPVYALAEKSGDGFRVVVREALTGNEVGSVPLPDLPMSYWPVPPLALDGDVVYAGFQQEAHAVNWRTGEAQPAAGLGGGIPEVAGGFALAYGDELDEDTGALDLVVSVVDAATGADALVVPLERGEYGKGSLSPDGRYLRFTRDGLNGTPARPVGVDVYDVVTGDRVGLEGVSWGWTSAGLPFRVKGSTLEVCDLPAGTCTTEEVQEIGRNLRLGGVTYES